MGLVEASGAKLKSGQAKNLSPATLPSAEACTHQEHLSGTGTSHTTSGWTRWAAGTVVVAEGQEDGAEGAGRGLSGGL